MGSFSGHALPGGFFILFGLWSTVNQFRNYHWSRTTRGRPYQNFVTFKCFCLCGRLSTFEIEGFLKIFVTTIGFVIEIIWHPEGLKIGSYQHGTMYFFFGLNGVIDVLQHHQMTPKYFTYISAVLALTVEGLLFTFHTLGKTELDAGIHTLIAYAIFLGVVATLVELQLPHSLLAGLARSYFMLLQGTWFWQVGYILYASSELWIQDNHDHIMLAKLTFTWHMGAIFVLQLIIGGFIGRYYSCKYELKPSDPVYESLKRGALQKDTNDLFVINFENDGLESEEEH